jgi:ornithine carbamoyltransferase
LPRHLITGSELSPAELSALLDRALELKAEPHASRALAGRSVALVFEQPSTRTRTSFEAGIVELGGHPMVLRPGELQLTRGESVRDTALVLSRHVAAIGLRTGSEETLAELAEHAEVPVVNMLSPEHHPCQALADLLTMREAFGTVAGRRLTYVGDGNNVARSLAVLGARAGVEVTVAAPAGYQLEDGTGARLMGDPLAAADGADVLYTDVWVSMSDDAASAGERRAALGAYRIDDALLDRGRNGAFALHCLPAHPGEEITAEVLYGSRQRIWDQAENRRHAQKALLEWLVGQVG